jgi:hypothetical protein
MGTPRSADCWGTHPENETGRCVVTSYGAWTWFGRALDSLRLYLQESALDVPSV